MDHHKCLKIFHRNSPDHFLKMSVNRSRSTFLVAWTKKCNPSHVFTPDFKTVKLRLSFHRKRSTFQNVWRQSSGTKCTWTLTSNVLKVLPFLWNVTNNYDFGKEGVCWSWEYSIQKLLNLDYQVSYATVIHYEMIHGKKAWFKTLTS